MKNKLLNEWEFKKILSKKTKFNVAVATDLSRRMGTWRPGGRRYCGQLS
jgi:hypothetical protein